MSSSQGAVAATVAVAMHDSSDEEGGTEMGVTDSDFGISDRQMQDIWDKFRDGNSSYEQMADNLIQAETSRSLRGMRKKGTKSTTSADTRTSGSAEVSTPSTSSGAAAPAAPAVAAPQPKAPPAAAATKGAAKAPQSQGALLAAPWGGPAGVEESGPSGTSFHLPETVGGDYGDTRPSPGGDSTGSGSRSRGKSKVKAVIASSREVDKITWYLVKVEDGEDTRLYMKRYSDFKKFDQALRHEPRPLRKLADLPTAGAFGIRHRFNIGDFNAKREQGLQRYLDQLLKQVDDLSKEKVILHFLGPNALGRVTARQAGSAGAS